MAAATTTAPSLSQQIAARSLAARTTALREWRALARAAVSGDTPTIESVEDLGRAIGLRQEDAADVFAGDVDALRQYPAIIAASDQMSAQVRDALAPFGDDNGLAVALAEATERLAELRRVEVKVHYLRVAAGQEQTRARYLAAAHPRVFGAEDSK